jgi:hypothetical protein
MDRSSRSFFALSGVYPWKDGNQLYFTMINRVKPIRLRKPATQVHFLKLGSIWTRIQISFGIRAAFGSVSLL